MPKVRIYQPDKSAIQSGKANMKHWVLVFVPETPLFNEGLMGWTGSRETSRQIELYFPTKEAAIAYARKHKLEFELFEPHRRSQVHKTYADNFRYDKIE